MAIKPQVGSDGKVYYIEEGEQANPAGQANEVGLWDILKRAPRELAQVGGDLISGTFSPNLTPLGGEQNAQDYILKHLESDPEQEWSWPREIAKATGRGVTQVFVPKAQVDVGAQFLGEGAGALAAGAGAARSGARVAAEEASRGAARRSATQKLQASARTKGSAGYHTRRGAQKHINREELPGESPYSGPRPTEREFERYRRGTGEGAGIPDEARPGTTSPVGREANASKTANRAAAKRADPVEGHQLNMARYRAGEEIARDLLEREGRLPTPDEIAQIDDPVARQAVEEFVKKQGPVARDLQEGRQVASELGERRDIASEMAERREIQNELQARRNIGREFTPTQPSSPMPPTNQTATMPPPQGAPLGAATDRGATMPPGGGPVPLGGRTTPPPPTAPMPSAPPTQPMPTQPGPPPPPGGGPRIPQPLGSVPPRQGSGMPEWAFEDSRRASISPVQDLDAMKVAQGQRPPMEFDPSKLTPEQQRALLEMTGGQRLPGQGPSAAMPPTAAPTQPQPMPPMGTRADLADVLQSESDAKVAGQYRQLQSLPDYGHWKLNSLMQEIFRNNPNISVGEFLELMRKGGGSQGAPPLPF